MKQKSLVQIFHFSFFQMDMPIYIYTLFKLKIKNQLPKHIKKYTQLILFYFCHFSSNKREPTCNELIGSQK
jgi:hypothetical protein